MYEQVGEVYVDSGQFAVVSSEALKLWEDKDYVDARLPFQVSTGIQIPSNYLFNWDKEIDGIGKSLNQLNSETDLEIKVDESLISDQLNYRDACFATLHTETRMGILRAGTTPKAIVSSTCYGDGVYPVYSNGKSIAILTGRFVGDRIPGSYIKLSDVIEDYVISNSIGCIDFEGAGIDDPCNISSEGISALGTSITNFSGTKSIIPIMAVAQVPTMANGYKGGLDNVGILIKDL